jgi:hypothetical protein
MPLYESTRRAELFGNVYFVETCDRQYLKIGFSTQVQKRLHTVLGIKLPGDFALRVLGSIPGTRDTESWFHVTFAPARVNGEWFRQTPEIQAFLEALGFVPDVVPVMVVEPDDAPVASLPVLMRTFIASYCVSHPEYEVPRSWLFEAFRRFVQLPNLPDREIRRALKYVGYPVSREPRYYVELGKTVRVVKGLQLHQLPSEWNVSLD